jgi:hypothetical protein
MPPEPSAVSSAQVSDDLPPTRRGTWGFSAPRLSEAPSQPRQAVTLGCQGDIIVVVHRPSRTVEIQAAESPENSGRFTDELQVELEVVEWRHRPPP